MLVNIPKHQLSPLPADWNDPIRQIHAELQAKPGPVLVREYLRALGERRYGAAAMIARAGRERTPFPVEFPHWRFGHAY